jgi:hypothetical protein
LWSPTIGVYEMKITAAALMIIGLTQPAFAMNGATLADYCRHPDGSPQNTICMAYFEGYLGGMAAMAVQDSCPPRIMTPAQLASAFLKAPEYDICGVNDAIHAALVKIYPCK